MFQNPSNIGMGILQAFEMGQQKRRETDYRNALGAYATNPSAEGLNALASFNPEFVIQERARMQESQRQQQQSGIEGLGQFRPLLQKAMESPEGWQEAITAARAAGYDLSRVPQQYDPEWARGQLMILDAAESGELTSIMRDLQMIEGFDPETPQGQEMIRYAIEGKYASDYVDEAGNTRRRSLPIPGGGGQGAQQPPQQPQRNSPLFSLGEWNMHGNAMSKEALAAIVERDRPVIINSQGQQVQTGVLNGEVYYNVNGNWYDNPEGR